jgi:membrane-associated phospholipid phosphatase
VGLTTQGESADDPLDVCERASTRVWAAHPSAVAAGLGVWQLQDVVFFIYIAIVLGLLIAFGGHFEPAGRLIADHVFFALCAAAALVLAARWPNPLTRFLRWWYPLLLCTFCFEAIGHMVHLIQPRLIDARLVQADQSVFGTVLTPLLQDNSGRLMTEVMYIFYSSYYFLIPGIGLVLYFRNREKTRERPSVPFRKYMLTVSLTYWVCYLHFLFTPAGGPVFWPRYPGPVREMAGGPITAIEQWVFNHGTIVGGAFPSSHVAVAVVCAWFAIRCSIVPVVLVPLCTGLAISTVYAGYHYGVDVLYGIAIGVIVTLIAARLFAWQERRRSLKLASGKEG